MYVCIFGCAGSSLLCGLFFSLVSRGYSVAVMLELLTEVASLAVEHRLNICAAWAWLLQGVWDLSGSGIKPASPA